MTCKKENKSDFLPLVQKFREINYQGRKMSELPCYTILSLPTDLEAPNEQQLKTDLEKGEVNFSLQIKFS